MNKNSWIVLHTSQTLQSYLSPLSRCNSSFFKDESQEYVFQKKIKLNQFRGKRVFSDLLCRKLQQKLLEDPKKTQHEFESAFLKNLRRVSKDKA